MVEPGEFKENLKGVTTIMATPFTDEGEVSEERLRNHINFMIEGGLTRGTGTIVSTGSMGECGALTTEERKRVLEISVDAAQGRVPIVAGCNHSNVNEVIELAQHAEENGAAGIMLLPTYYFCPPDEIILRFYQKVAQSINLGIMLYNNEHVVRKDVSIEVISKLTEIKNVVAIKECTNSFTKLMQLVKEVGDKILVLNGHAEFWEPYAKLIGCPAFISGMVNFVPRVIMNFWKVREEGTLQEAFDIRAKLSPTLEYWAKVSAKYGLSIEPSLLKEAAKIAGSPIGPVRLPVPELSETEKDELKGILKELIATT